MRETITMKKVILNTIYGIACGCTIFTFLGIVFAFVDSSYLMMSREEYITNAMCAIISGIGSYLPTIIYSNDRISKGLQVLVHMGICLSTYFVCAFYAGWIPVKSGIVATISSMVIMTIIAFMIWFGFYIYNKNEARKINAKLQEK